MGISVSSAERSESSLDQADTSEISGAAVHSPMQMAGGCTFQDTTRGIPI